MCAKKQASVVINRDFPCEWMMVFSFMGEMECAVDVGFTDGGSSTGGRWWWLLVMCVWHGYGVW